MKDPNKTNSLSIKDSWDVHLDKKLSWNVHINYVNKVNHCIVSLYLRIKLS